jgi:hypothetical protein
MRSSSTSRTRIPDPDVANSYHNQTFNSFTSKLSADLAAAPQTAGIQGPASCDRGIRKNPKPWLSRHTQAIFA